MLAAAAAPARQPRDRAALARASIPCLLDAMVTVMVNQGNVNLQKEGLYAVWRLCPFTVVLVQSSRH
jgi:hypothetical protein